NFFLSPRNNEIGAAGQYSFRDGSDLLQRLPLAQDYLGEPGPDVPVMIYPGKSQVLIRQSREPTGRFIDVCRARAHLFQKLPQLLLVHLPDINTSRMSELPTAKQWGNIGLIGLKTAGRRA